MSAGRAFRFGVVAAQAASGAAWAETACRAEALGFATLVIPDTLQHSLSPFPALAAAAAATQTLRVGSYVLANDLRNPVLLAKDAATLDFLSGGRFELGIGAGRPGAEADYRAAGLAFGSGGVRVSALGRVAANPARAARWRDRQPRGRALHGDRRHDCAAAIAAAPAAARRR
jgi:alkanesulfonate monooxygenase SsuD/methylene tetrahydromethanopterin reductase-like flavin-dependent oxidoreductase (luciferase family)